MANFKFLAEYGPFPSFLNECIFLIISLIIPFLPIDIIISLLKKRKAKYKHERSNISKHKANFEHIDHLTQSNNQKEHIKEVSKLMIENEWQERY